MHPEQGLETQRIDHLGIVAGICHEIGLIEQIDQADGSGERKVTCGQAVQAMVLNALGFTSRALYVMPDYPNEPVGRLIDPAHSAAVFNDKQTPGRTRAFYSRRGRRIGGGLDAQTGTRRPGPSCPKLDPTHPHCSWEEHHGDHHHS